MFCPYCGTQVSNDSAFCMSCGKQLNATQAQAPTEQQAPVQPQQPVYQAPVQQPVYQAPVPPVSAPAQVQIPVSLGNPVKNTKRTLLIVIPIVAVLVAAIVLGCMFLFKSDEDKIRDRIDTFATACNEGDIEGMINCFDKKTRKTYEASMGLVEGLFGGITGVDIPIGDMVEIFGMEEMGGQLNMDITVESIAINGNTAQVKVTLSAEGEAETDEVVMCKEEDDWFIDMEATTGQSMFGSLY